MRSQDESDRVLNTDLEATYLKYKHNKNLKCNFRPCTVKNLVVYPKKTPTKKQASAGDTHIHSDVDYPLRHSFVKKHGFSFTT